MAQDTPMIYPQLGEPLLPATGFRLKDLAWSRDTWVKARLDSPFKLHGMWEVRRLAEVPE